MARRMLSSSSSSQYLHLLSEKYYSDGLYSLRRMDASTLFYPSTAKAKAAAAAAGRKREEVPFDFETMEDARFLEQVEPRGTASEVFARFGGGSKILCADVAGHATVYDAEEGSFVGMPAMNSPKGWRHAAFSVSGPRTPAGARSGKSHYAVADVLSTGRHGDSVYVLGMKGGASCFEELAYRGGREGWRWRTLPPPPPLRDPPLYPFRDPAHAVVGGGGSARIHMSIGTATYTFDTASREWSKAGDWVLPFSGRAEHVPELGVWLGLSPDINDDPYGIYAVDLTGCAAAGCAPPTAQLVGMDLDPPPPEQRELTYDPEWSLEDQDLVNLGSGRLCVARFFNHHYNRYTPALAVFTGVEVVPTDDAGDDDGRQAGDHGGLSLIRHKSQCIMTDGATMRLL